MSLSPSFLPSFLCLGEEVKQKIVYFVNDNHTNLLAGFSTAVLYKICSKASFIEK